MRYRKWSAKELDEIKQYVVNTDRPYDSLNLTALSLDLDRSEESVRGAINRALKELDDEMDNSQD